MCKGKDFFLSIFPYQLSVNHGLLPEKRVEQMRQEEDFSSISWAMEMESLFYGLSENAFFKLEDIDKCRTMVKPFYPQTDLQYIENKKKRRKSDKQNGELRLIGIDIALMGGDANDNTIITCMRLLPNGDKYIKQVPYIESLNGMHSEKQAIRLKQLYYDFEADYVVMDTEGSGMSLYDDCAKILYDEERDVEYPAWSAKNNEEMKKRALDDNAIPIIYSIKARQEMNHEMAMGLKSDLEKGKIKFLVNEIMGKEHLRDKKKLTESEERNVDLMKPYYQTTALVNELVNLEYEVRSGFVKIKEVGKNRKDRYSSLAYTNLIARQLETELLDTSTDSDWDCFLTSGL